MRTVRDLRDLVNVSRLSFKDSDEDDEPSIETARSVSSSFSIKFNQQSNKPPLINLSQTTPIIKAATTVKQKNSLTANSLLLDRNSIPSFSLSNKKILPPLSTRQEDEPISLPIAIKEEQSGNFDDMLTYIDASVVSEWLNRANRSLRKMHKWHQDNTSLFSNKIPNSKQIKYEPFVLFANFWLGAHHSSKFDHKQRRQLIEMEHSIICDEVTQAFQVGIDSQQIGISDIHRLLRAVLKEYPLQLLSFRGVYLLLDYIEILSSNRHDDYRKLLSDVKCRTLNKQFAQWLLSIRSFALINLCWAIIKFYRKTVETNVEQSSNNALSDLDGRLSSLSFFNKESNSSLSTSSSTSSSLSSSSSRIKSAKIKPVQEEEVCSVSNQVKYDFYTDCVFKFDLPEVLHYLILTKKCDPFKCDEQNRTLIFLAVMNDKPKLLNYLIKRWSSIDVNEACSSGNTPLHAAVNKGNISLVEIILQSLNNDDETKPSDLLLETSSSESTEQRKSKKASVKLDVNKVNDKCMSSTALHLACWNDFNEIAVRLIQANADPLLKMNGMTNAFDLALENSNQVLYELLKEYSNSVK